MIEVIAGDAFTTLKAWDGGRKFDLLCTEPPFSVGSQGISEHELTADTILTLYEAAKLVKPGGWAVVMSASSDSSFSHIRSAVGKVLIPVRIGVWGRLDLVRGRRPRGVAGQAFLASFQKFLRPAVIEVLDDPFAPAQLGNAVLAAQPVRTIRIFSSAENWRRVTRRISFTTCLAGSFTDPDFCAIFAPSMATMGQKSSLPQLTRSVS
jgi:hypothetical protein